MLSRTCFSWSIRPEARSSRLEGTGLRPLAIQYPPVVSSPRETTILSCPSGLSVPSGSSASLFCL